MVNAIKDELALPRCTLPMTAWAKWYEELKIDIKANKFMFSRSSYGRAFRAGYDAAMSDAKKIVKDGEEWKLWGNDQA